MNRLRTAILVFTPLVAVLVLVLGLRIGGKDAVHAATIWGAPASGGRLVLQVVTMLDDRGVRESVPLSGVHVAVTETETGAVTTFDGDTNADGVIEVVVPVTGKKQAFSAKITARGEPRPLAEGTFVAPTGPFGPGARRGAQVRATQRTGELVVDTFVTDERLVVGKSTPIVVRVTTPGGENVSDARLSVVPEPGVEATPFSRTCKSGYGFGAATALFHTVGMRIEAELPDGRKGATFAAYPVAHGAYDVDAPRDVASGAPFTVTVRAPNVRRVAYTEIDDEHGRVFATPLAFDALPAGPSATFQAPPLAPGLYWIVTASDPKGAERIEGATVARVLRVGHARAEADLDCDARADLAMHPGDGFVRTELLDGLPGRREGDTKRARLGLTIALVGLFSAAIVETVLALRVVREAREAIESAVRASERDDDAAASRVTRRSSAGSVVVGVALVVLGFALLAALLVWKA